MYRRGFTIVELIIVITIMGILLTLGVVNLRGSQIGARDSERVSDVENISLALEDFYRNGNDSVSNGSYAGTSTSSATNATIVTTLRDIDIKIILAPGVTDESTKSLISATNTTQTTVGVTPQPEIDQYVYQPLLSTGALCTSSTLGCRKFNIFYRLESDNTVYMVTSKNQ
jgi:prepilin-type N-terminal cleavage/methylation domain-containing protein